MRKIILVAGLCIVHMTAFAQVANQPDLQVEEASAPWWATIVTTTVLTIIGLISRWFKLKFLQKQVTDVLVKQITSKDPSVSPQDIEHLVASAFSKQSKNGTQY